MNLLPFRSWALAAVLACLGLGAQAQEHSGACKADTQKLCKGTKPGGGRMMACLKEHEAELSPGCKEQLPKMAACAEEVKKVCGQAGPRKTRECMKDNADKLKGVCHGQNAAEH